MQDVVTIEPMAGGLGLVAYQCPKCRHVSSVLISPRTKLP